MLHVTGEAEDMQWFTFKPAFFGPPVTIEWDRDTMDAVIPTEAADLLLSRGHARNMTASEARAYNKRLAKRGD